MWAVKNASAFNSQPAAALAKGEVDAVAMNSIGREFPSESNWLTPGGMKQVLLNIDREDQYTHVGVAVLYPTAHKKLIKLCQGSAKKADGVHQVTVTAGQSTIE